MRAYFKELSRRNVFRVAAVYTVVGWLLAQAAVLLETSLGFPAWFDGVIVGFLLIGFPIAMILAWAFELTPAGMKPTTSVPEGESIASQTGRKLDYAILIALMLVAVLVIGERIIDRGPLRIASDAPDDRSIAVLPFADMSEAGDQEYFADGLTEEILNVLTTASELRVAGRTSSFQFRGQNQDLRAIGEVLGVTHILEGSIRKSGDDIRITAQLIKADDGFHLWSETYDRKLSDLFRVQEEIATAIGAALKTPLGIRSEILQKDRTDNPEAYGLYLEGLAHWFRRGQELALAIEKLERAVALEPNFAAAWATLSLAYNLVPVYFSEINGGPVVPFAYDIKTAHAANKALRLNPGLASAHHAMANVFRTQFQWLEAEDHYLRALDIEPEAHAIMEDYREFLTAVGRFDEAGVFNQRMLELDPLNALYRFLWGRHIWFVNRDQRSLDILLPVFNEDANLRQITASVLLAIYINQNRLDDAVTIVNRCDPCTPLWWETALALIEQIQDPKPEFVLTEATRAMRWLETPRYVAGGPDALLDQLEYSAFEQREPSAGMHNSVFGEHALDTPRYKLLLNNMGLPAYWRERGWPDNCRPLSDNDFECDLLTE